MSPTLIAISGVSGTGKTTLIQCLEKQFPRSRVITYTTRAMRPGESESDYHFISRAAARALPDTLWVKENYGALYAVTRDIIMKPMAETGVGIMPTITSHHTQLKEAFPEARYLGFHIKAPPRDVLVSRMHGRGDTGDAIAARLAHIHRIEMNAQKNPHVQLLESAETKALLEVVAGCIAA